jgi:S-adenosylmethionine:diacylglycerol 3-amino-3-carboxypropyl transferase
VNREDFWELFGHDTLLDFFHVDSKPDEKGERHGVAELTDAATRLIWNTVKRSGRRVLSCESYTHS